MAARFTDEAGADRARPNGGRPEDVRGLGLARGPTVADRKMREAGADRANEQPPGTSLNARGRGGLAGRPGKDAPGWAGVRVLDV